MGEAGRQRAERLFSLAATAGVLGEKFIAQHGGAQTAKHKREETPIVYLVHEWKGDALLKHGPSHKEGVRWIAEKAQWSASGGDRATLEEIEALPDANVIESIWVRRTQLRQALDTARGKMGDTLDSTDFYVAARHAVYLAETLPHRGTRHIHAWRSDAVVTVWLLKQLRPELKTSCAIEENPAVPRSLLARLVPAFDLKSVSDARLNELLESPQPDELMLELPFRHKELRVGPLKVKRKVAAPPRDRKSIEREWLKRILKSLA